MSIASIGGFGGMVFGNALSPFLSQTENTQSAGSATDGSTCDDASSSDTTSTTSDGQANNLSGSSKAAISSEILALLIQLQMQSASTTASSSNASTASATTGASATTSTSGTRSSTTANPIASLFSSIDTSGGSTISESDFESYIENLGGTQNEADSLFTQLGGTSSSGLSLSDLEQDAQSSAPMGQMGPPPGPPPQMSASQAADSLVSAMGGTDGTVTQSEFENFVTSNGGTTSEADTDFSKLDTSGSTTLSASDLQQAIENQQAQTSSSTSISPLLSWLDSLSATASGTPTA
jgi:Ca2+-binding EF-hand superfamily protein